MSSSGVGDCNAPNNKARARFAGGLRRAVETRIHIDRKSRPIMCKIVLLRLPFGAAARRKKLPEMLEFLAYIRRRQRKRRSIDEQLG